MFLSCRPFVVITIISTGRVDVEVTSVSWLGPEVTSTPTRPVENVVIRTKALQVRNNLLLDGRTEENKGKLILCWSLRHKIILKNLNSTLSDVFVASLVI